MKKLCAVQVQVAFQQADYVAWNLWASINGRPLLPFKYQHLGEMMSLGRARGAVTLPLPLAPPLRQALDGGLLGSLLSVAGIKCAQKEKITHHSSQSGLITYMTHKRLQN